MNKPITIVGGGLAGLTLGVGLLRCGVRVMLWEAGRYPRHRVCGEFISGRGLETLERLGLRASLEAAGARTAQSAAFFSSTEGMSAWRLPSAALCLSRADLDALLAREFGRRGGELRAGMRWPGKAYAEGVVRATGRRTQSEEGGDRWFGLKVHARRVALSADLEMHLTRNGYVGLCRLGGGEVNVCGLFRREVGVQLSADPATSQPLPDALKRESKPSHDCLRGRPGSPLHQRLRAAEFDQSTACAVAGLSLRPHRAGQRGECCVGDAITMIPPITGNGMSMAFESAELAIEPLTRWSRGEIGWPAAQRCLARRCDAAFSGRLVWARWLHRLLLSERWPGPLLSLAGRSDWVWRFCFDRTR